MKGLIQALWLLFVSLLTGCQSSVAFDFWNPPKGMHPPDTPEGYLMLPGDNVAYKMYNDKLSWDESRARCISDGGDLAIADTSDKIYNIKYLNSGSGTWSWVGFRRHSISEEWLRVDNGLPAKSLPWITPPEAFLQLGYDCAAITYGSKITDLACRWAQTSICEIGISEARNVSTNTTSVFPDFVYPDDKVAYKIYKDNVTWDEARHRCISDGGDLAVVYTREKIQQLESIVSAVDSFHVGIHKPRGILDWISVNDETAVSSIAWAEPYPALRYSKRACALLSSGQHAIWNIDCDNRKAGSVCEIPIGQDQLSVSNTSSRLHQKHMKNVLSLLSVLTYFVCFT